MLTEIANFHSLIMNHVFLAQLSVNQKLNAAPPPPPGPLGLRSGSQSSVGVIDADYLREIIHLFPRTVILKCILKRSKQLFIESD